MSTTKVVPGVLIATPDADQAAREAAIRIARTIRDTVDAVGRATIALSGGHTPLAAYGFLAKDKSVDWSKVDLFWVDERAVPPTDAQSNYAQAKTHLVDAAPVPPAQVHRMRGESGDLDAAARAYEELLRNHIAPDERGRPVFDLIELGIGDDGHTASLFPGEPAVEVRDRFVVAVPAKGDRVARLTLTAPVIEAARSILFLAVGKAKNVPLERVWEVSGTVRETPARVVRDARGAITWIIDRAAAGLD